MAEENLKHEGKNFEKIKYICIKQSKVAADSIVLVDIKNEIPLFARVSTIYKDASKTYNFKKSDVIFQGQSRAD